MVSICCCYFPKLVDGKQEFQPAEICSDINLHTLPIDDQPPVREFIRSVSAFLNSGRSSRFIEKHKLAVYFERERDNVQCVVIMPFDQQHRLTVLKFFMGIFRNSSTVKQIKSTVITPIAISYKA